VIFLFRHPAKYGSPDRIVVDDQDRKVTSMPIHHRVINALSEHPFATIIMTGVPFAGVMLYQQSQKTHLTVSQRVMASRVYAQAGVIVILLSTMGFREYMDKHGRFPEPGK
jgi:hypothetical protein